jgi:signal transduction histidine kinase/CheY-like chemotaxis protein
MISRVSRLMRMTNRGAQDQQGDDGDQNFDRDRHFRGVQSISIVFLGSTLLAIIAWLVFFATIHRFDIESSLQDRRQVTRLLMAVVSAAYWYGVYKFPASVKRDPSLWNHSGLALATLLLMFFGFLLTNAETVHEMQLGAEPRLGTTVLIFTLVFYCVATQSKWLIATGMLVAAIPILFFNAHYLSKVAQGSFLIFLIGGHLIGMIVYSSRFKQDLALNTEQTRVKKLVTELDLAAKHAVELSSAKTRLIATVSHDLRQPLNSLALYNNLLKSRFGGDKNVALNSIAVRVDECVSAMDGNLRRLQDIALLQSSNIRVKQSVINVVASLITLESVFSPIANASGVKLKVSFPNELPLLINSNPERLFEILSNLVSNGIKFSSTNANRKPWVLVKVRRIRREADSDQIQIDVRDNGIGIESKHQSVIFDEYVQLANPERSGAKGYGLGLSIVRELCGSLEGHELSVRSALNAGACFTLRIPELGSFPIDSSNQIVDRETNLSVSPTPLSLTDHLANTQGLIGTQIILIEDDDQLRSALTAQLQDLGAQVRAYPSAKHALAATANDTEPPTCIISDYWLPEPSDGLQTIAKLREQLGESIPALLISAASDIDPKRLETIPNLEFALKPVSANTLLSYVRKHHRLE